MQSDWLRAQPKHDLTAKGLSSTEMSNRETSKQIAASALGGMYLEEKQQQYGAD